MAVRLRRRTFSCSWLLPEARPRRLRWGSMTTIRSNMYTTTRALIAKIDELAPHLAALRKITEAGGSGRSKNQTAAYTVVNVNTVRFTILMAAVKSHQTIGWERQAGRSLPARDTESGVTTTKVVCFLRTGCGSDCLSTSHPGGTVWCIMKRLRAFSDWGWGVKLLLVPAAPVGHSLLSAVGAWAAASWGPEGRRPNLYGDLRGNCLPLGSGLLPGSPYPSFPRERHSSANALGGNSISFRWQPPRQLRPSGTRCHQPTSGAG